MDGRGSPLPIGIVPVHLQLMVTLRDVVDWGQGQYRDDLGEGLENGSFC